MRHQATAAVVVWATGTLPGEALKCASRYGYYGQKTTSLYNMALQSLGYRDKLAG